MMRKEEKGFSLVEMLIVVVVIGVIAAIAVPAFQKGIRAAENSTVFSALRTISSTQVNYYSSNNRFARLTELQPMLSNALGTTVGDRVIRNRYTIEMNPLVPTDTDLKTRYTITATRSLAGDITYKYELREDGEVRQLLP